MEIDLADVRRIVDLILAHIIEEREVKSIELEKQFYWNIPSEKIYDMSHKPDDLDIGSFPDDWGFLVPLLNDVAGQQPVAYQLTELAPLLRYIGEVMAENLSRKGG